MPCTTSASGVAHEQLIPAFRPRQVSSHQKYSSWSGTESFGHTVTGHLKWAHAGVCFVVIDAIWDSYFELQIETIFRN